MHIADGYLSPQSIVTTYAVAIPLWMYGIKKLKVSLNEETLPKLAALSALSFIIMMFNIPVPGGSSAHAVGTALLAIMFGPWVAYISVSMVLLIQAVIFGDGGITAIATEAIAMGFIEAFVAYFIFKKLQKIKYAPFIAGYVSIVAASFITGLILGLQANFVSSSGKPLYFPFGIEIAIPAMVLEHLIIGIVEGIFTQVVYSFLTSKDIIKRESL